MPANFLAGAFDLTEEAPAKINLALHVTGRRDDGYHLLDMLVTFADHGDRLGFRAADEDGFELSGRFGRLLAADTGNLVLKARDLLRDEAEIVGRKTTPVHIHLEKNLPLASGIGGGSADAAATLRGLMQLWGLDLTAERLAFLALKLGADVPMCLASRPLVARGIGEDIIALAGFPSFHLVLGNPLVGISTPEVFRRLESRNNAGFDFDPNRKLTRDEWLPVIDGLRNDLEPAAATLCGEIGVLSRMMLDCGARLTRMSGSGATCFGLFDDAEQAAGAAAALHRLKPDWYFQATQTIAGGA